MKKISLPVALHTNKRTQLDSQGKKLIEKHTHEKTVG